MSKSSSKLSSVSRQICLAGVAVDSYDEAVVVVDETVVVDDMDAVLFLERSLFDNCCKFLMFFCKNSSSLIFSQAKRVLLCVTTFFAVENSRSIVVFDAGIEQITVEILAKIGNDL